MLSPISFPSFKTLALSLLLANIATSTDTNENEPQLLSNISLVNTDDIFSLYSENPNLNARALECGIGYSECAYDTSRCCPIGGKCCGNGYCANIGETCCTGGGTCPVGFKCCDGTTGCAPLGGECCSGGYYCRAGKRCRVYKGEKVCCAYSGCIGEYDGIGSGATLTVPDVTSTATETEVETTRATTTYVEVDWDYYYTTVYWTYWYYYWTSYAPYTVRTVTSTTTSTRTIWSVYETNRAEATSSLSRKSTRYSFSTPYEATSLKSSTEPVTLSTGASAPSATASDSTDEIVSAGPVIGASSAESVGVSGTGILAAVFIAAIGGLAFGL
ncbi:hypothetical protein PEX1_001920 [Penicillium expansum]|uniref:GPI anchored protein n=1 Tax=Penicillium expansum TaxID=27334 RepID=A0A0A2JIV3_PENEN|nr:hypothetical protein PEX2_105740 [Penicillium expansum]KAJ5505492.1 hypothetical protein N7453_004449 [Penicillium expansum]KGO37709.1 hypothetical protein PEXP_077250 [Penicillium expansum]KGO49940.1 hypothetical protein PEX2_105740 [Penicillium expansum]KGO55304.1 hypothetical protein PEX1_001920 [Penicillium expansum]